MLLWLSVPPTPKGSKSLSYLEYSATHKAEKVSSKLFWETFYWPPLLFLTHTNPVFNQFKKFYTRLCIITPEHCFPVHVGIQISLPTPEVESLVNFMLMYQYSLPTDYIFEKDFGRGNSSILVESLSLQHSERMKNLLLTWALDLKIRFSKTKIPYVIYF